MDKLQSLNFGCLQDHDECLTVFAARAERYVFDDPNTSLLKLRQFAELLARHIAAFHGIDTSGEEFHQTIATIRSRRLAPREVTELLDQLRLRGNEAAHDDQSHRGDVANCRRIALAGLISAHRLAGWFQQTFVAGDFAPGPFKPPPNPRDAEDALRLELDALREEAARHQQALAQMHGEMKELHRIRAELEREAEEARQANRADKRLREQAQREQEAERRVYEHRLREIQQRAPFKPPAELDSFITRSQESAKRLGLGSKEREYVPLAQLRVMGPHKSSCCRKPMLLVQSSSGGFVTSNCSQCGKSRTLGYQEFFDLDLWVSCPKCRKRMEAAIVDSNYGFVCSECNWRCYLASLLPMWNELV